VDCECRITRPEVVADRRQVDRAEVADHRAEQVVDPDRDPAVGVEADPGVGGVEEEGSRHGQLDAGMVLRRRKLRALRLQATNYPEIEAEGREQDGDKNQSRHQPATSCLHAASADVTGALRAFSQARCR